ncbi:MAG: hypothetical protein ACRD3Q_17915 [Terriglobales bacterium]
MAKTELTISLDSRLTSSIRTSAEPCKTESELIEQALFSHFNLGSTMGRIHAQLGDEALGEEEADALALEEVKAVRAERAKRS